MWGANATIATIFGSTRRPSGWSRFYSPGTDVYNYEHDPAFKATPGRASGRRAMGGSEVDIRYDVPLDDSLFGPNRPRLCG